MIEFLKSLAELGGMAAISGLGWWMFYKFHTRHAENSNKQIREVLNDAKEDRKENREVQSKVADAINSLAVNHKLQERALRETLNNLGKGHEPK